MKISKFGTKNTLFGYFWVRIFKKYCHIWNQHPQVCQTWVFDSYNEFWCRVPYFLKVRGLFFLKMWVWVGVHLIKYSYLLRFVRKILSFFEKTSKLLPKRSLSIFCSFLFKRRGVNPTSRSNKINSTSHKTKNGRRGTKK